MAKCPHTKMNRFGPYTVKGIDKPVYKFSCDKCSHWYWGYKDGTKI